MENEMTKRWVFAVLLACLVVPAVTDAKPKGDTPRGELLYTTHCIACHTDKIHWRDNKAAKNWISLKAEVRRWQGIQGLVWSDNDVAEVARYLNARYYHYPEQVQ
jgi:mono/diheme cytochrome c family protein